VPGPDEVVVVVVVVLLVLMPALSFPFSLPFRCSLSTIEASRRSQEVCG
jgi:hypothetical protein